MLGIGGVLVTVLTLEACDNASAMVRPDGAGAPAVGTPSEDAVIARGAQLYAANCLACHGDRNGRGGLPYVPSHGPDGHTWHHSDRDLTNTILNGSGEMGEMMRSMMGVPPDAPRMPAWKGKLSQEEVGTILAYIKTFWTPEQRRMQERSPMMP